MSIVRAIGAMAVIALLTPAVPARAAIITYEFEAQVSLVVDPGNLLGSGITPGTTFTGRYVFDSATPDQNGSPTIGTYRALTPPSGISMDVGGFTFATDPANVSTLIEVDNQPNRDAYLFRSFTHLPISQTLKPFSISLQLDDLTGTAFNSDALPLVPPNLALFTQFFGLTVEGGRIGANEADPDFIFRSTLLSLREVPTAPDAPEVPEPGTLLLMMTGGVGLVSRLGRRRPRASATHFSRFGR